MLKPQDEVVVHMFMFSLSHVGRCGFLFFLLLLSYRCLWALRLAVAIHPENHTVRINYLGNRC